MRRLRSDLTKRDPSGDVGGDRCENITTMECARQRMNHVPRVSNLIDHKIPKKMRGGQQNTIIRTDKDLFLCRNNQSFPLCADPWVNDRDMNRPHRKKQGSRPQQKRSFTDIMSRHLMTDINHLRIRDTRDHPFHLCNVRSLCTKIS